MKLEQIKAVMLGHAVGDALGVPVEFVARDELADYPVTKMLGFGTFPVPAGAWSDDTSMSLCALASLAKGKFDLDDVMVNLGKWYGEDEFTPTGMTFDMGETCSEAIENYFLRQQPVTKCGLTNERSNGNGSLMRIHPFALFLADSPLPEGEKIKLIHSASAITHAHKRAMMGCGLYSFVLWELLKKPCKMSVPIGLRHGVNYYSENNPGGELSKYLRLFVGIGKLPREEIVSGGYVVNTLEAAIWCLMNTKNYRDCVLTAVNLGGDTDTTAAVAGGLAGALYGYESIPGEWLETLLKRDEIETLCTKAYEKWMS